MSPVRIARLKSIENYETTFDEVNYEERSTKTLLFREGGEPEGGGGRKKQTPCYPRVEN